MYFKQWKLAQDPAFNVFVAVYTTYRLQNKCRTVYNNCSFTCMAVLLLVIQIVAYFPLFSELSGAWDDRNILVCVCGCAFFVCLSACLCVCLSMSLSLLVCLPICLPLDVCVWLALCFSCLPALVLLLQVLKQVTMSRNFVTFQFVTSLTTAYRKHRLFIWKRHHCELTL
jgi:hypothetical protein